MTWLARVRWCRVLLVGSAILVVVLVRAVEALEAEARRAAGEAARLRDQVRALEARRAPAPAEPITGPPPRDPMQRALADAHRRVGRVLFDQLRYRDAAAHLRAAVTLDPEDAAARDLLERVEWICGEPSRPDDVGLEVDCGGRVDRARREVVALVEEGERLLGRGDHGGARERFERALEAIRWFPYSLEAEGLPRRAEAGLAEAERRSAQSALR